MFQKVSLYLCMGETHMDKKSEIYYLLFEN